METDPEAGPVSGGAGGESGPAYASQAERAARRPTDAQLRDQSQGHLDARRQRLDAYEASLEDRLAGASTTEGAAAIEGQLEAVRRQIRASTRARLPRASDAAPNGAVGSSRALAPLRRAAKPAAPRPAAERPSATEE